MIFKSGFISVIGKPNAGKSTFLNSIHGEKVSIVSNKPQTTRVTTNSIITSEDSQMIFLDNPGIHKNSDELSRILNKSSWKSLNGVDIVVYIVSAIDKWTDQDDFILKRLNEKTKSLGTPIILLVNKIDKCSNEAIDDIVQKIKKKISLQDIILISALKLQNIDISLEAIKKHLPEGPLYYDKDAQNNLVTDVFWVKEIIREKAFNIVHQEIPYSIAVQINYFKNKKNIISISASIIVERDSQKGIIIGKNAKVIKSIGISSREELQAKFNKKIFLELDVKLKKNWKKDELKIKEYLGQ